MGFGGFRRMVNVLGDVVLEHKPIGDIGAIGPNWHVVDVPKNIPNDLNTLIAAGALLFRGGKIESASDWAAKVADLQRKRPNEDQIVARAAKNKALVSAAELAAAKAELENELNPTAI